MKISRFEKLSGGMALAFCLGAIVWWRSIGEPPAPPDSARSPAIPGAADLPPPDPAPILAATTPNTVVPNERICPKTGGRGCRCGAPTPVDTPEGRHLYPNWPGATVRLLPAHEIASHLHDPNTGGEQDVEYVVTLLDQYRRAFGAMPVGELNDEIVRRLQGQNPKGLAVLPKSHPALNASGELVDRWGTPFRFHPESALLVVVRSAGPDQKMWTGDDILSQDDTLAALDQ